MDSDEKLAALYQATTTHAVHAEQTRWTLLYNYLVASTILLLACVTLLAANTQPWIVTVLAGVGVVVSVVWIALGQRGTGFVRDYRRVGEALESRLHPEGGTASGPFEVGAARRAQFSLVSTPIVVAGVPIAFAGLFVTLLFYSLVVCGINGAPHGAAGCSETSTTTVAREGGTHIDGHNNVVQLSVPPAATSSNAGLERLTKWLVWANWLLVFVTAAYVLITGMMVGAMRRSQIPRLVHVLKPFELGDKHLGAVIRIVNAGPGPAYNIDAVVSTDPARHRWPCVEAVMMPNESREYTFPPDDESEGQPRYRLDRIAERTHRLALVGAYEDAFGKKHTANATLDVRATLERWKQFGAPTSTVGDHPMADIASQVQRIADSRPLY